MSEGDLELLITLDDPVDAPEVDIFNHLQTKNIEYWLSQRFLAFHQHQEDHNNEMLFAFI